jgi:hypothetical protein
MTLRERQVLFVQMLARLIDFAYAQGYELTLGEAYRTPEQAALNAKSGKGIFNSLHTQRLAIDLNLFKDGRYLSDSESYRPLGEYWKSLHPDCCFGGDFKPRADGNHFSISYEGRK